MQRNFEFSTNPDSIKNAAKQELLKPFDSAEVAEKLLLIYRMRSDAKPPHELFFTLIENSRIMPFGFIFITGVGPKI